ncbi:hypothetical protein H9P43_009552 [Blastocladiella emersonii ATCC 22665]|nr:hypothetical protein H9P43_009552 [Blastocladiella emersonii ATCC 22665]
MRAAILVLALLALALAAALVPAHAAPVPQAQVRVSVTVVDSQQPAANQQTNQQPTPAAAESHVFHASAMSL